MQELEQLWQHLKSFVIDCDSMLPVGGAANVRQTCMRFLEREMLELATKDVICVSRLNLNEANCGCVGSSGSCTKSTPSIMSDEVL